MPVTDERYTLYRPRERRERHDDTVRERETRVRGTIIAERRKSNYTRDRQTTAIGRNGNERSKSRIVSYKH